MEEGVEKKRVKHKKSKVEVIRWIKEKWMMKVTKMMKVKVVSLESMMEVMPVKTKMVVSAVVVTSSEVVGVMSLA